MPWSPALGRPLLQLHTSLRPDELAGNMHEDIWYCQRILRLPLSARWLNLRRAVRRRQSEPSTKLTNLNTKSGQYHMYMYICTYQENYWELRSLSDWAPLFLAVRHVTHMFLIFSMWQPAYIDEVMQRQWLPAIPLHVHKLSAQQHKTPLWRKRVPKLLFFMLIWRQLARLFSFYP